LPGAIVIDRGVLEWRLAPSSDYRTVEVVPGQRVILVCNEGYQSSLAAAVLIDLGVDGATDLIGGFRAWRDHVSAIDR
jgi:rhodanese-related sulfurtransferase